MHDDLDTLLRAGTAGYLRTLRPRPPAEIRARGDQRRRRAAAASAAIALAVLAGGGATAYTLGAFPGHGTPVAPATSPAASATPSAIATPAASPRVSGRPSRPGAAAPGIAAVTTAGAVVVLSPATGATVRTLVPGGALPDEISVSPDGATVYYAARRGCGAEIYSVPMAGGPAVAIAAGAQPAISPDGTRLAYLREPFGSGGQPQYQSCGLPAQGTPTVSLVIRVLATGAETVYRKPPAVLRSPFVYPVSHLSWSPDGSRLLLSMGEVQDNAGYGLVFLDPLRTIYYVPRNYTAGGGLVPLAGSQAGYYREGVFLPNGDLLVNVVCCQGLPATPHSSVILEVKPSGAVVRQVAVGFAGRVHSSFDAYRQWALYLSGTDLYVSRHGQRPGLLTSGLIAAAWAPPARH